MSSWIFPLIVAVVVIDAVILWWIFTRRRMPTLGGMTFGEFRNFANATGTIVRDYMRANYSGRPEQLDAVLPELLTKVQDRVMSKGIRVERPVLKRIVVHLLTMEKIAGRGELESAMERVS